LTPLALPIKLILPTQDLSITTNENDQIKVNGGVDSSTQHAKTNGQSVHQTTQSQTVAAQQQQQHQQQQQQQNSNSAQVSDARVLLEKGAGKENKHSKIYQKTPCIC
jgi:hypothetical protein